MRLVFLLFITLVSIAACQPAGTGSSAALTLLEDANIQVRLTPADAPAETPLQLQLIGPQLLAVHGELTGVSMYMGRIPLRFTQQGEIWQAEFLLGACSDPNMQWQLHLQLEFSDGKKRTIKQQFHSSWQ